MLTRYCDQTPGARTREEITHGLTTKMSGLTICLDYVTEMHLVYLICALVRRKPIRVIRSASLVEWLIVCDSEEEFVRLDCQSLRQLDNQLNNSYRKTNSHTIINNLIYFHNFLRTLHHQFARKLLLSLNKQSSGELVHTKTGCSLTFIPVKVDTFVISRLHTVIIGIHIKVI